MPLLLSEFDASFRYSFFVLANVVIIIWTYKVVVPARVGWTRFMLAFPLFPLCYLVFTLFDYERPSDRNMLTGLSLNRGPLVKAYESGNFGAFIVALLLNVNVAFEAARISPEKKSDDSIQTKHASCGAHDDVKFTAVKCKGRALGKKLFFVAILLQLFVGYLYRMQEEVTLVKSMLSGWYLYGWLSGLQDMSQFFSLLLLNIQLQENFNHPYLSDSFSDFWARRWNLVMGAQLRELCYEPVVQGQWIAPRRCFEKREAPINRRLIGTFLTFFASAAVHVVCLAEMFHNHEIQWDYGLCFIISPFIVGFEILLRAYAKSSESMQKMAGKVPRFARIVFINICIPVLGHYTFLPAAHRGRVFDKIIDSLFATFKIQPPIGGVNFQKLEL